MEHFNFNPETHTYTIDRDVIPSVSEVLDIIYGPVNSWCESEPVEFGKIKPGERFVFNNEYFMKIIDTPITGKNAAGSTGTTHFFGDDSLVYPEDGSNSYYADRGRRIHEAIKLELQGGVDRDSLVTEDEDLRPYIDFAVETVKKSDINIDKAAIEVPRFFCSPGCYSYGFTPDLTTGNLIIDWKSGTQNRRDLMQMQAYIRGMQNVTGNTFQALLVYLKQGKTIKVDQNPFMMSVFSCALACWQERQKK